MVPLRKSLTLVFVDLGAVQDSGCCHGCRGVFDVDGANCGHGGLALVLRRVVAAHEVVEARDDLLEGDLAGALERVVEDVAQIPLGIEDFERRRELQGTAMKRDSDGAIHLYLSPHDLVIRRI